ncbi:hypothetical protein SAMN05444422_1156 [Halobiforma haloterrestris]|uniref:Uncharacterized protein n=1 Tax=Natronobacterium haloterrestre TaxID=148448 RepID=A0A1I1L7X8_NATHA|nr:hypothetical protein SAMN05444422_1156 [Halobiforma haloterrestris]
MNLSLTSPRQLHATALEGYELRDPINCILPPAFRSLYRNQLAHHLPLDNDNIN